MAWTCDLAQRATNLWRSAKMTTVFPTQLQHDAIAVKGTARDESIYANTTHIPSCNILRATGLLECEILQMN